MDTVIFVAGKLVGLGLLVEVWISLALLWVLTATLSSRWQSARRGVIVLAMLWTVFVLLPTGPMLLRALETQAPRPTAPLQVDGIILLGGGVLGNHSQKMDQLHLTFAGERLTETARLAIQHPDLRVILTGGAGNIGNLSSRAGHEGHIAADFLRLIGVAPTRITIEDRSRTTREHPTALRAAGLDPDNRWLIVTSAFHMPRVIRAFETDGWQNIVAYPVDYRVRSTRLFGPMSLAERLSASNIAIREQVGRVSYALLGRY